MSRTSTSTCGACDVACTGGQACCASGCSDTNTDPMNCGGCGTACTGEICSNGRCCPAGQIYCGGASCIVPSTNASCGACGRTCPGGLSLCNCAPVGGGYGCRNDVTGAACG
ncbi:MAG: hypothetical protein M5U28_51130 [Sandaracinaceae bacterium]|nr:hypothetical protein [Sandaracinaceae bacterium]